MLLFNKNNAFISRIKYSTDIVKSLFRLVLLTLHRYDAVFNVLCYIVNELQIEVLDTRIEEGGVSLCSWVDKYMYKYK